MPRIRLIIISLALALAMSFASAEVKVPAKIHLGPVSKKGLSRAQAKQILIVVLKHKKYGLDDPYFFIDELSNKDGTSPHPGYWDFDLAYDTPKAGAIGYLGMYSVSMLTGDVWETEECKRFIFPTLQRLQKTIMKQTGKTFADEKEQRRGLGCTDE